MEFIAIPAGSFLMGAPDSRPADPATGPQHQVTITKPFYLGVYEVTQWQFSTVMVHTQQHFAGDGPGRSWVAGVNTDNLPADTVSWVEARWFCDALSLLPAEVEAGRTYRLPTEAEWEYACRAGTQSPFAFGDSLTPAKANMKALEGASSELENPQRPMPVGSFFPNAFGLYDMHGNVWEWCEDGMRTYERSDVADPLGPSTVYKVVRGGAWDFPASYCRSDYRQIAPRSYAFYGLRLICEIDKEKANAARADGSSKVVEESVLGNYKAGYSKLPTTTPVHAVALHQNLPATQVTADVLQTPFGLRPLPAPIQNPLTTQKIALGKQLFFDPRLSSTDTVSCASCHQPDKGWSNGDRYGHGIYDRPGSRSVPTLLNVGYSNHLFWDGRVDSLEELVLVPIQHESEMGLTLPKLIEKINSIAGYRQQFEECFDAEASEETIALALASFVRTLRSGNAPLDRYRAGELEALSPAARRGHDLFFFKSHCSACHRGPTLSDDSFHNTGIGMEDYNPIDEDSSVDLGRQAITGESSDEGAFKTPTLREIARTAPYMHDGRFKTLEEVVDFYNDGGEANVALDGMMNVLMLTDAEKSDLVTFLKEALTSDSYLEVEPPKLPK